MRDGGNAAGKARSNPLRVLRHRDFRLLWGGLVVSAVGTWMQIVAQSLLVLKITNGSAFSLGLVSLASAVSFFLFSLPGGSVADRVDRRTLLLVTQSLQLVIALLLGILTAIGAIQVWMIIVATLCTGAILSFDQPTRNALLPTLVPRDELMGAVSLQSMVFNGASAVGPALAGIAIGIVGLAGNFFLNAASFLAVLAALRAIHAQPPIIVPQGGHPSLFSAIRDGLNTVKRDDILPWVLSGFGALLFFGPSPALVLPIYATEILHLAPFDLGLLFSAAGVGTIAASLILSSLGDFPHKGWLLFGGLTLWTAALMAFAVSKNFTVSIVALLLYGLAQTAVGATAITVLQLRVPAEMRGRVMSLVTLLVMGVRPLGDFPAGALIGIIGAPPTVLLSAAIVAGYTLHLLLARPALRRL
jgi:MFS family permease